MIAARYEEAVSRLMETLKRADALKEFRSVMLVSAEITSREMIAANDVNVVHGLRGQMRICFELADRAALALDGSDAPASAEDTEGIPEVGL